MPSATQPATEAAPATGTAATAAVILAAAADLIEKPGSWTRAFTARGPVKGTKPPVNAACLATEKHASEWGILGAIFKIGRERGLRNNDCYSLGRLVAQSVGAGDRLADWAGQPGRTQAECVAALRAASAKAVSQ